MATYATGTRQSARVPSYSLNHSLPPAQWCRLRTREERRPPRRMTEHELETIYGTLAYPDLPVPEVCVKFAQQTAANHS